MFMVRNRDTGTLPCTIHANGCIGGSFWKYLEEKTFESSAPNFANIPDDLSFITWDTSDDPHGSALIRSLQRMCSGGEAKILGHGIKEWYRHQIILTIEYLEKCETKYVMGHDAWDAVFLQSPGRLLEVYKSQFSDYKLVYGAETNFWPDKEIYKGDYMEYEERQAVYHGATKWRYLNSGAFIGEVEFCKKWYEECLANAEGSAEPAFKNDEQGLVHMLWASDAHKDMASYVTLDYQCQMFQNLFGMDGSELDLIEAKSVVQTKVN